MPRPRPRFTGPDFQMSLVLGAAGFYLGGLGVIIVVLAADLGVPPTSLAWMGSIFGVALLATAPFGPLALRWGANPLLAACTFLSAAGFTLLALAPTLPLVAVGAALQALGGSFTIILLPILLAGTRAHIRVTRANAVSSVVSVAAPLLIGLLIAVGIDGRRSLLLAALPMLVVAVVAVRNARLDAADPPPPRAPRRRAVREEGSELEVPPPAVANPPSYTLVVRRWLCVVLSVAAEFSFLVWAVARLVDGGLDAASAATVGAAFPVGMAVGRVLGPWLIERLPAVPVGAAVAAAGTVLVVVGPGWPVIAAGLVLAGLGIATLYPVTLVGLMNVPRLPQPVAGSLAALASGTAIIVAPAGLAALAEGVELRLAFLVVLPLLLVLVLLRGRLE